MRLNSLAIVPVVIAALTASCANQDRNASIKKMNEGVQAFNGGQTTKAQRTLKEAAQLYPENHKAWYSLGQIYSKQEKWEEAAEALSNAVKYRDEDAMYHYRLGRALLKAGKLDLAETHLERAVELNKRLYKAWWYLGTAYNQTDRPGRAAKAWTTACGLNPIYGPPFIDLGRLYIEWDKLDQAISVLDQGRLHVKDREDLTDIFYYLGLAHDKKRDFSGAVESFTKALEVKSNNLEAKLQRGFAHADAGSVKKAKKDLEEFVDQGGGGNSFNIQAANDRLMRLMAAE